MSMLMRLGGMSSVFAGGCIAEKVLLGPFLKRFAPALLAQQESVPLSQKVLQHTLGGR